MFENNADRTIISVVTPTFNRLDKLKCVYNSLVNQTNKNFIWIVVDDGSTDGTRDEIHRYINEDRIRISYFYQQNQGKHAALNQAIKHLNTEIFFILDSDDCLTDDAIDIIFKDWDKYKAEKIISIHYLKMDENNKIVGDKFLIDYEIGTYAHSRVNKKIKGDKLEVWKTELFHNNLFPIFSGEKFLGEAILWSKVSKTGRILFVNKSFYICEYLDDGLSRSGRSLRLNNPNGGAAHALEFTSAEYSFNIRVKNAILFNIYGFFSKDEQKVKPRRDSFLLKASYPFSIIIYFVWKIKYRDLLDKHYSEKGGQ